MTDDATPQIYLRPRDWSTKQTVKYSNPRWIKTYSQRLFDDAYRNLNPVERSALHGLELLYALSGDVIPLNVKSLNSKLALSTKISTWEALNRAGFVDFTDHAPEHTE